MTLAIDGGLFEPLPFERFYLGAGAHRRLGEELDRLGVERALLLTGRTLAGGRLIDAVRAAAGERLAGEFAGVAAHNPTSTVEAASGSLAVARGDGIVAFGGGSVVDCAKAVSFGSQQRLPIVDLATTLSGAEFACSFGQTDDETRVKLGGRDRSLTARAVFLDPELTAETPDWLWAATGMRAVDHAVETILAPNSLAHLDVLAAAALQTLATRLLPSVAGDAEDRMACLQAAMMAHAGSFHIEWGLSHQMGRQLGPRFDVPHGVTSAVLLPAVVELQADAKVEQEARVAAALGVAPGTAGATLRALARSLSLPTTLRDAGLTDRAAVDQLYAGNQAALAVVERAW